MIPLQRTKPQAQHRLRCRLSTSDSSPSATPDQQPPLGGWGAAPAAPEAPAAAHMGNGSATQVGSVPVSQQQQSKQIDTIAKKAIPLDLKPEDNVVQYSACTGD